MDMSMYPVVPELTDLPLSDPRCRNESCNAYLDAENDSQATISWLHQFEYGRWVTYYYVIIIGILLFVHIVRTWHDGRGQAGDPRAASSALQKMMALGRFIAYRRISGKPLSLLGLPSFGMLAFLLTTVVFLVALTFAVKPYYREHLGYGSPPLAIRCGLMAFACIPILIALAGKANIVTLLTGISHEKLNVVHRWVAWMSLGLSLAHGIPYFLQSYWDGPFYGVSGTENVSVQFYAYGSEGGSEFSGVPPLAILFGLCILSLPWIRERFYESFYFSHILLGITYIGLLFWHAGDIEDSWVYLWATIALWLASYFARLFWYTKPMNIHRQWFSGAPTTICTLPGGMTRIEILAPEGFSNAPAQHCFLRFPSISLLDNHPFTIIPSFKLIDLASERKLDHPETLSFLVRTHTGFTHKLAQKCASDPDNLTSAWIDGPYGGINRPVERLYDNIVLIAGGSGISACLPWLLHLMYKGCTSGEIQIKTKRVVLVWAMREPDHFCWAKKALEEVLAFENGQVAVQLQMKFYVTSSDEFANPTQDGEETVKGEAINIKVAGSTPSSLSTPSQMSSLGEFSRGRPKMHTLIAELVGAGKTLVFGCGPESLLIDLSNACASAQVRVMKGEIQEVSMHLESFGW